MSSHAVIGGSGFIGRHVVRALIARGDDVSVVDMVAYRPDKGHAKPRCRVIDLSTATAADFDDVIGSADTIHHYAWSTIPQTANADPLGDIETNLGSVVKVLEAIKRRGGGRIIFPSSGGTVYGRLHTVPVPETHPLAPVTAYGASKAASELYLNVYRSLHGVDARVARVANPFGAGQNPTRPQGVASTIIYRALAGEGVEVWGTGDVVRDFIHINDAVSGLLALADAASGDARTLPVYNIASGRGASINEIIGMVQRHFEQPIPIDRKPDRPFDVPTSVLDVSKANRELDWAPAIDLDTGIKQMIEDLRAEPARLFSSL